jgi:hypothetical protein
LIVTVASLFMVPFSTLLPIFARDILAICAQGGAASDVDGAWGAWQRRDHRNFRRPHAAVS